jgi:hypothetical protein
MKTQLVNETAQALTSYGFTVYISKTNDYGFYTDGERVVSFGGQWNFCLDYSGNYKSNYSGTGWGIAKEKGVLTEEEANAYIKAHAPNWAVGSDKYSYTTPEQHLATYGKCCGYNLFTPDVKNAA